MHAVHVEAFDLNLLLAFDALWTERHVTRAARRVGLTQSAMSHALGRLRAQLDDPLFQPTPRGLSPTARAHALAPRLAEALALVRRARRRRRASRRRRCSAPSPSAPPTTASSCCCRACWRASRARRRACSWSCGPSSLPASASSRRASTTWCSAWACPRRDGRAQPRSCSASASSRVARRPSGGAPAADARALLRAAARAGLAAGPRRIASSTWRCAQQKLSRRLVLRVPHFLSAPLVIAESDAIITLPERLARAVAAQHRLVMRKPPLPVPGFSFSQYLASAQRGRRGARVAARAALVGGYVVVVSSSSMTIASSLSST